MNQKEVFKSHINEGYACKGESLILGSAILDGEPIAGAQVKIALKTMNRHGLIAGATGTGKTKTLQVISEQLSEKASEDKRRTPSSGTSYGRRTRTPQDQMVKVLRSATFIRGVFGILKKVMK